LEFYEESKEKYFVIGAVMIRDEKNRRKKNGKNK
jgi:hypothetical protein